MGDKLQDVLSTVLSGWAIGIAAVLTSSILSGFASVYLEKALKQAQESRFRLVNMFCDGHGGPKDVEARRLYGLAAAQGDVDAQCGLACMLLTGRGGPKNGVEARRLLGLAAANGHADAQCGLACVLYTGHGGPKDEVEARRLFGLAAAQGDAEARYRLANMFYEGHGGPTADPRTRWRRGGCMASRPRRDVLTRSTFSLACSTKGVAEQRMRWRRSGRV